MFAILVATHRLASTGASGEATVEVARAAA
jgi:hypothetical protein